MTRVAFQGAPGAFSELAAVQSFPRAQFVPCRDFKLAAAALFEQTADYAVLPVENTIVGTIAETRLIVADERLRVISDLWIPIHHALLAVPGAALDAVRSVLSLPVALALCSIFCSNHPALKSVVWYDTAGAAQHVAHTADQSLAAIASALAADRYGLSILADHLEDRPDNRTRFAILAVR